MARIRRVIKKIPPASETGFDEKLWPVNIALLVLGSFLLGTAIAYLRPDDPRWWANRLTWMLLVPLLIGGVMFGLTRVNSRKVRRAVQLATVVSLILHIAFVIMSLESKLFSDRRDTPVATRDLVEPQRRIVVPEYARHHFVDPQQRPKEDFEKPVETETPQTQPQEVTRQETQPEPKAPEPQPTPVPDPLPTSKPDVVQRQQPVETMPRQSEQASQLSRRQASATVRPNQTADSPQSASKTAPAQAAPSTPAPQSSAVARQTPSPTPPSPTPPAPDAAAPSAQPQPKTAPSVARREPTTAPQPTPTAAPTLRRQTAQPTAAPRTAVATAEAPAATQKTTDDPLKPQTTLAQKQTTAAPDSPTRPTEVAVDTPRPDATTPERREQPAETRPAVAQTPTPAPAQRVRTTARPDPATVAETATPAPTTVGDPTPRPLEARPSTIARTAPSTAANPSRTAADSPAPTPDSTPRPSSTATARRSSEAAPSVAADAPPSPSIARQTGRPNPAPSVTADAAATAAARQTQADSLAASSTALRKQESAAAETARSSGEPAPATNRTATATASPSSASRAAATTGASPEVAAAPGSAPGRQTAAAAPNVVTNAANVATNAGPQATTELAPSANASTVVRQAAGSSAAAASQTPQEAASASPTTQVAQSGSRRSSAPSAVPSLDPTAPAGSNPTRTMTAAAAAASPTNVESPAASVAAAGSTEPAAQPAPLAMSRGASGMAGAGASANLDRASPAADRPALAASGAARRAEASQTTPEGPALAPSDPAVVKRTVAGAARPASTMQAENVPYATAGGAANPTELNASSSAAVAQASSNAESGAISAAKGSVDVDLGPTQIVGEQAAGRASGGGQPELNLTAPSQMIARSKNGGAPQASIAATAVAAAPVAPEGTSGGAPAVAMQPLATATVRTQAGGEQPLSGGPTAGQAGPPTEVAAAPQLADAPVSRADAAEGAGGASGGQPTLGEEDEEEKRRRLARAAAGGGPQLALQGPAAIEAPTAAPAAGGGGPAGELTGPTLAAARSASAPAAAAGPAGDAGAPVAAGQAAGQLAGPNRVQRAEAVEAASGAPVVGGGTGSPTRAAGGAGLIAAATAEVPVVAGAEMSGGAPQGAPLEAQGVAAARSGDGVRGAAAPGPVGAIAADVVADGRQGASPGVVAGSRAAAENSSDAPSIGQLADGGPALRRMSGTGRAGGAGATGPIDVPSLPAEVAQANEDHMGAGSGRTPMERQSTGAATAVELAAVEGPGGLGSTATPDVGVNSRRALADATQVQLRTARYQRQKAGGVLNVSTAAVAPTDPFRGRSSRTPGAEGGNGSPPPQTEESVELGLAFLARYQNPDGSWTLKSFNEEVLLSSDTAATALALLAFQGAGYNHREHKYKDNVRAALDYMVKNQKEDGDLFLSADDESNRSVWLYSHSIAALALCEAYGMTQDPALKEPAQKALDFIVAGQHRERGGWRYAPGVGSDTSVTGWMMMALKSGELAGLKVPSETYGKIRRWLDASQGSGGEKHLYRYNPYAPDTEAQRHGRAVTKTMTSVGLLMRLYTGWRRDNPDMIRGADYLKENLPAVGTLRNPERDTYYWYYATQVMFHMGGDHWAAWNGRLHPLLTQSQIKQGALAGSWDPNGPVPDRWAVHAGRLYVTVMNLLSLEVYYRHLPLYDDTAK